MSECIDLAYDHILLDHVSSRRQSDDDNGDNADNVSNKRNNTSIMTSIVPVIKQSRDSPRKCVHNRNKYYCKDCGGAGICEHQRE